jgi:hypothetical protein
MADSSLPNSSSCARCFQSIAKKAKNQKRSYGDEWFCIKCYIKNIKENSAASSSESISMDAEDLEYNGEINIPIPRTRTEKRGCLFKCERADTPTKVPISAIVQILSSLLIIIPKGTQVCAKHLTHDRSKFLPSDIHKVKNQVQFNTTSLNGTQVRNLVESLIFEPDITYATAPFDLMSDFQIQQATGFNRQTFDDLTGLIRTDRHDSAPSTVLGVYLNFLYTADSSRKIAARFELAYSTINKYITLARKYIKDGLTNFNLGISTITRADLIANNSDFARILYKLGNTKVCTVWDGTYLYLPKSNVFQFQKATFGGQKKTNYVKPMTACSPNGKILDLFGPNSDEFFKGEEFDGTMMLKIMEEQWFKDLFRPGDVFVLDRGFKNAVPELKKRLFEVYIPCDIPKGQQLTWKQANANRFCTSVRWIVEAVNMILKRFKFFQHRIDIHQYPHLKEDARNIAAIHNKYGKMRLRANEEQEAEKIERNSKKPNKLQSLVTHLHKKIAIFFKLDASDLEFYFPILTGRDMKILGSSYGLKLVNSYFYNHLYNNDGKYEISVMKEEEELDYASAGIEIIDPCLIRGKFDSRHSNSKSYHQYVLVDKSVDGLESIKEHYCTCSSGARTVEPCAHVLTLIWYLGYARYELDFPTDRFSFLLRNAPDGGLARSDSDDECVTDKEQP